MSKQPNTDFTESTFKSPVKILWTNSQMLSLKRYMGKERKGKERKGKERKGTERKGKERKGKEVLIY